MGFFDFFFIFLKNRKIFIFLKNFGFFVIFYAGGLLGEVLGVGEGIWISRTLFLKSSRSPPRNHGNTTPWN